MPDHPRNRKIIVLVLAIVIVSLILGGISLLKTSSTESLEKRVIQLTQEIKSSNARSECRNRLNNQAIGNFQVDIRDLLLAYSRDRTKIPSVLDRMAGRPDPNSIIEKQCPIAPPTGR